MDKANPPQTGTSVFDDAAALIALATAAFEQAAREAVAENDRLGITTHCSVNGKIVERNRKLAKGVHLHRLN